MLPDTKKEALEILKSKKKGNYNIVEIDLEYKPAPIEHKDVYGVTFEQGRNELKIDESSLLNIVTESKELPESAKRDLIISLITLKYTQSNSVCYAKRRSDHRRGRRSAVKNSLHTLSRQQSRQLAFKTAS